MRGIGFLCHAENDNVNKMALDLAAGFEAIGYDYQLIDTRLADAGQQLLQELQSDDGSLFLCCFNNIGLPDQPGGPINQLLQEKKIPVLSWYLDHPVINALDFTRELPGHILAQNSPGHLHFLKRVPLQGDKPLHLLPHAANIDQPFHEGNRKWPCLFVGTIGGMPDQARNQWADEYGSEVAEHLNKAVELYLSGHSSQLEDLILAALSEDEMADLDWPRLRSYCLVLDRYLRDRLKLMLAAICLDLGGLVAGPGFSDIVTGGRADQMPGAVPAENVTELMRDSQTTFMAVPEYYQSHERLFLSAAAGSVPITGEAKYAASWLKGGCITLDYQSADQAREQLASCLADPEQIRQKAHLAYQTVEREHQYRHRAAQILDIIRNRSA